MDVQYSPYSYVSLKSSRRHYLMAFLSYTVGPSCAQVISSLPLSLSNKSSNTTGHCTGHGSVRVQRSLLIPFGRKQILNYQQSIGNLASSEVQIRISSQLLVSMPTSWSINQPWAHQHSLQYRKLHHSTVRLSLWRIIVQVCPCIWSWVMTIHEQLKGMMMGSPKRYNIA
jgi:outer membrane usher protein FimD/PapC